MIQSGFQLARCPQPRIRHRRRRPHQRPRPRQRLGLAQGGSPRRHRHHPHAVGWRKRPPRHPLRRLHSAQRSPARTALLHRHRRPLLQHRRVPPVPQRAAPLGRADARLPLRPPRTPPRLRPCLAAAAGPDRSPAKICPPSRPPPHLRSLGLPRSRALPRSPKSPCRKAALSIPAPRPFKWK